MVKFNKLVAGAAFLSAVCTGCYEYPKPPVSLLGESYTAREQGEADKLLEGITSLSLAEAQKIALLNNPDYISASQAIEAARFRYYQAIGAYSPTLGAGFRLSNGHSWAPHEVHTSTAYGRGDTFSTGTSVSANWLLFDGLSREFSLLASRSDVKLNQALEADACRLLMQSVANAYNTVLAAIENQRIAEENKKFQDMMLEDARKKHKAGVVPMSNVLNFEILANNAEVDRIAADNQYEVAVYALAALMGYPHGTLPENMSFPHDYSTDSVELPSVEVYLDAALANRPDLRRYRESLEISKYQMYQTISSFSPTISAFANFDYNTNMQNFGGGNDLPYDYTHRNTINFSYGLQVDWTIFSGLSRYNKMRESQANLAIAEYAVAMQWLNVVSEVRTAYTNYMDSVKTTRIYERTREFSERQRNLVEAEYRAGNVEITRLNEAQRDLVAAETSLSGSRINILNAKAKLESVVGVNTSAFYLDSRPASENAPGLEDLKEDAASPAEGAAPVSVPAASPAPVVKNNAPAIAADPTK